MTQTEDLFRQASAKHAQQEFDDALRLYARVLGLQPDHRDARRNIIAILEMVRTPQYHDWIAGLVTDCLEVEGANYEALSRTAAGQLRHKYAVADGLDAGRDTRFTETIIQSIAGDRLFFLFLSRTLNRDYVMEVWLTALRRYLATSANAGNWSGDRRQVAAMLAVQAFNNEYIWSVTGEEENLVENTVSQLQAQDSRDPGEERDSLLVCAMYGPLGSLAFVDELGARPKPDWPAELRPVARASLYDRLAEREIAGTITQLSPIVDEVSLSVGQMYEENPYPRWLYLERRQPIDVLGQLARSYPRFDQPASRGGPVEVLMPGSGTGQHPLSVAVNYRNCRVTAVDLSLASLAYAKRMAENLGVENIEFLRGDILELHRLERRFDLIECVGVLHHMRDPAAGFASLVERLRPGGFMRIGLYGEHARRDIVKARAIIAEDGYEASLDGLRSFRRTVAAGDGKFGQLRDLMAWDDFYSASLLRDLVFHVQEHQFTLPKLRRMIEPSGVEFVDFEFATGFSGMQAADHPARALYRREFPGDKHMADLERWEWIESRNPDLFQGYAFLCRKPGPSIP